MKKLQMISVILFFVTVAGFILWRFVVPFPDWLVRVNGVLMLITIFTAVFSTVRITMGKKQS
jgi:uncharacterized membrane protein YeiB